VIAAARYSCRRAEWFTAGGLGGFARLFIEVAGQALEKGTGGAAERDADRGTVLVVDDDSAVLTGLKVILEDEGFSVWTARDGREALALLRATRPLPAVILLDLMMPVMSGDVLDQHLSTDPALAPIPVITITAATMRLPTRSRTVLRKPFKVTQLLDAIRPYELAR
jgi:CheY-like chemotaxis protein